MNKNILRFTLLAGLLASGSASANAAVAIIGNPGNANQLTQEQVTNIYLGKTRFFPDGKPVKPLDQSEESKARTEFITKVLRKSESALKSHWSTIIFTGNGSPPEKLADDESVKKRVSTNSNAIGYIDPSKVDNSVKVLLIVN